MAAFDKIRSSSRGFKASRTDQASARLDISAALVSASRRLRMEEISTRISAPRPRRKYLADPRDLNLWNKTGLFPRTYARRATQCRGARSPLVTACLILRYESRNTSSYGTVGKDTKRRWWRWRWQWWGKHGKVDQLVNEAAWREDKERVAASVVRALQCETL